MLLLVPKQCANEANLFHKAQCVITTVSRWCNTGLLRNMTWYPVLSGLVLSPLRETCLLNSPADRTLYLMTAWGPVQPSLSVISSRLARCKKLVNSCPCCASALSVVIPKTSQSRKQIQQLLVRYPSAPGLSDPSLKWHQSQNGTFHRFIDS